MNHFVKQNFEIIVWKIILWVNFWRKLRSDFRVIFNFWPYSCVYFLRGYCAKGSKCTFRHEKPKSPEKKKEPKPLIRPLVEKPKPKTPPKNDVLEFRPGASSHGLTLAEKLSGDTMSEISAKRKEKAEKEEIELAESKLCPYLLQGKCTTSPCPFIHGIKCDTCGLHCLIEGFCAQNQKHQKGIIFRTGAK